MTPLQRPKSTNRTGSKTLMRNLKVTTTVGALGLTLAGWGLLSHVEATSAAQADLGSFTNLASATSAAVLLPTPSASALAPRVDSARAKRSTVAVPPKAVNPAPTATPAVEAAENVSAGATTTKFKLDVVQWVQTNAGDSVAVVRDSRGVLWYVWGTDVPLIEQGLSPQYQPEPVNGRGRSRQS